MFQLHGILASCNFDCLECTKRLKLGRHDLPRVAAWLPLTKSVCHFVNLLSLCKPRRALSFVAGNKLCSGGGCARTNNPKDSLAKKGAWQFTSCVCTTHIALGSLPPVHSPALCTHGKMDLHFHERRALNTRMLNLGFEMGRRSLQHYQRRKYTYRVAMITMNALCRSLFSSIQWSGISSRD